MLCLFNEKQENNSSYLSRETIIVQQWTRARIMLPTDDYYEYFMREIVRDVPGDYGVFLPMQTWEECDRFVSKLEGDERFRGLMVNVLTILVSFKNSRFLAS